jgi:hypothetical protein
MDLLDDPTAMESPIPRAVLLGVIGFFAVVGVGVGDGGTELSRNRVARAAHLPALVLLFVGSAFHGDASAHCRLHGIIRT